MHRRVATLGLLLVCSFSASASWASQLTFTIDSALSHLSFALEDSGGTQISSPQTPGSDTTSLSGTMKADVTPTSIQFLSTGDAQFALQALPQAPMPGGAPGTAAAQFGLNVSIPGVGSGVVAARNYVGDTTSGAIPLAGSSFDASQTTQNLVTGNTAYNLTLFGSPVAGSIDTNFPAPNMLAGGTLSSAGGVYTLTLPILVKGPISFSGLTIFDRYSGQIVATSPVPEPSSLALTAIGIAAVAVWGRQKKRSGMRLAAGA
jgi:hypothetical protein